MAASSAPSCWRRWRAAPRARGRTGLLYDLSGNYTLAFAIGIAVSVLSAVAIWQASPGKVRAVAGQMHKVQRSPR